MRIGPYEIVRLIGAGGMGEVYQARDIRLGRSVALKVLLSSATQRDPTALPRLEREARAIASLNHPNIVHLYEFDTVDGLSFFVTELLEGETLGARIRRGPLAWRDAVSIAAAIADGLAAAHLSGVVHRDLKPENVFLTADGRVKLLDFGIARTAVPASIADDDPTTPISDAKGAIFGTIGYLAPEQLRGEPAIPASDIFSFGCVLHEMLSGQRAFGRRDPVAALAAILSEDAAPLPKSDSTMPEQLQGIVDACLIKDPTHRTITAAQLATTLRALLTARIDSSDFRPTLRLRRSDSGERYWPAIASTVFLVLSIATMMVWQLRHKKASPTAAPPAREHLVLVLPFSTSGSSDLAYLGDGLSEDLINTLSHTKDLNVVARSTAQTPARSESDPIAAAKKVGATVVVAGKLSARPPDISLQLDLTDVSTGTQLWGERYQLALSGMPTVQQQIASRVAQSLHVQLAPSSSGKRTASGEAYRLYLKGRYFWNKRTEDGYARAIASYEAALALDPEFAEAWSGLADCYVLSYALPERETMRRAKETANRAIALDPRLAEPHATLGHVHHLYDWDWDGAEAEFRKALALNPNYATAHHWFGRHLVAKGKSAEGLVEMDRAIELDPLSLIMENDRGYCFYLMRRYDEAVKQYEKTLSSDPTFTKTQIYIAYPLLKLKRYDEAIAHLQKAIEVSGRNDEPLSMLAHAYAAKGDHVQAASIRNELEAKAAHEYVPPVFMAYLYVDQPDLDKLMRWLEKAYADDERSSILDLAIDPLFDDLRAQPRVRDFVQRIGLPKV